MKNTAILILFIFIFSGAKAQKYNLIWSDEFNYSGLPDSTKWSNEVGFIRNRELQYYTDRRIENSVVTGGNLLIIGKKETYRNGGYTSASINTLGKYAVKYGKIEARMKLLVGKGIWPAFWMMGENKPVINWPRCGEIDVMEHINTTLQLVGTAHWFNEKHVSSGSRIPCDVRQFHNYSVEWNEDSIRWLLDNKRYYAISIKDSVNNTQAFHKPFYLLLNLAIGGEWPGNPDATTVFPDTVFVDYVRVYRDIIMK